MDFPGQIRLVEDNFFVEICARMTAMEATCAAVAEADLPDLAHCGLIWES